MASFIFLLKMSRHRTSEISFCYGEYEISNAPFFRFAPHATTVNRLVSWKFRQLAVAVPCQARIALP